MILIGDVGGTNCRLALVEDVKQPRRWSEERSFRSEEYGSFFDLVGVYLEGLEGRVTRCCLGVAGPVVGGRTRMTNLGWELDSEVLSRHFGWSGCLLINDLQAMAHAIPLLEGGERRMVKEGLEREGGNIAVLALGTGLGESILCCHEGGYQALPSEGGHSSFAPQDELQDRLLVAMRALYGHVSVERVCSGGFGLRHLYDFLKSGGEVEEPAWLAERLGEAVEFSRAFIDVSEGEGSELRLVGETLELLVTIFAAEAANLALKCMALGGVYVGGGLGRQLEERLAGAGFCESFCHKGRYRALMESIPVYVILHPEPGLLGASALACAIELE